MSAAGKVHRIPSRTSSSASICASASPICSNTWKTFAAEIRKARIGKLEPAWLQQVQYGRRQKQSEPQEKGRYLWFKEAVFNEAMCIRQGSGVGRFGADAIESPFSRMATGSGFFATSGWERQPNWRPKTKRGCPWHAFCKGCSRGVDPKRSILLGNSSRGSGCLECCQL